MIDIATCGVATCKPWTAAEQDQSGAEEGWIGAEQGCIEVEQGNAAATMARNAAENVWNAMVLAWSQAGCPSMAARRVKTPAVPGCFPAEQRMAGAEEGRTDRGRVTPRMGNADRGGL